MNYPKSGIYRFLLINKLANTLFYLREELKLITHSNGYTMETKQDLILGLNGVIKELHKKKQELKEPNLFETKRAYYRLLKIEINKLMRQRRTLEYLLVVG